MTTPRPLTAAQERVWRSIARMMVVLPRAIDDDLLARTGLTLTKYLVLSQLSEAPDQQLRMSDLASRTALSPSRMSRVVHALHDAGLVERTVSSIDHRENLATLTDAGLEVLREAWPSHLQAVRQLAVNHIRRSEVKQLTEIIERIVAAVDHAG